MHIGISLGINARLRGGGVIVGDASIATWNSDTDTYTQDLFVETSSFATWDSGPTDSSEATWNSFDDIYTQRLYPTPASATTDTYTQTIYGA